MSDSAPAVRLRGGQGADTIYARDRERDVIERVRTDLRAAARIPTCRRRGRAVRSRAEQQGSTDFSPLWAGQHVVTSRELPAADLTLQLWE